MTTTHVPRSTLFVFAVATAIYFLEKATGEDANTWERWPDYFVAVWALINAAVLAWEGLKK